MGGKGGGELTNICQGDGGLVEDVIHGVEGADFDGIKGPLLHDLGEEAAAGLVEDLLEPPLEGAGVVEDANGSEGVEAAELEPARRVGLAVDAEDGRVVRFHLLLRVYVEQLARGAEEALHASPGRPRPREREVEVQQ